MSDEIHINGDKVIAFINAVKDMGMILEQLNVIEVKDAFLVGKQVGSIEKIIEMRENWRKSIGQIRDDLVKSFEIIESIKKESHQCIAMIKPAAGFFGSSEYKQMKVEAKEFADLCDRIKKHQEDGTIELLSKLFSK